MSETTINIPLWAEIITSFFAVLGGAVGLLGASGVLRLRTFFSRIHAPALITTAGIWCLMMATITYFSVQTGKPALNVLLLGLFIAITAPVTTIFLMRAALFRSRQRGEDVPRSVNMLQLATPKNAPDVDREEEARREEGRRNKKAKEEAEADAAAAEIRLKEAEYEANQAAEKASNEAKAASAAKAAPPEPPVAPAPTTEPTDTDAPQPPDTGDKPNH